jgi:hypothetical protein
MIDLDTVDALGGIIPRLIDLFNQLHRNSSRRSPPYHVFSSCRRSPICSFCPQAINCVGHVVPNVVATMISLRFQRRCRFSCQRGCTASVVGLKMPSEHFDCFASCGNPHASPSPGHSPHCRYSALALRTVVKAMSHLGASSWVAKGVSPMSGRRAGQRRPCGSSRDGHDVCSTALALSRHHPCLRD